MNHLILIVVALVAASCATKEVPTRAKPTIVTAEARPASQATVEKRLRASVFPAAAPEIAHDPGITFFVTADTHLGVDWVESLNIRQIHAMNRLPGTSYPKTLGGAVADPLGVLVAGDLTNRGKPEEWDLFVKYYGLTGRDGMLRYPVFEGSGNHDRDGRRHVVGRAMRRRHWSIPYGIEWKGVHVLNLDIFPRRKYRDWLREELADIGPKKPIVIVFHYAITGPYSDWWSVKSKQAFRAMIDDYNVIAIFHGHYHAAAHYVWEGYDVYNVGSPMYYDESFAVVRVTRSRLNVAYWDWRRGRWRWWHDKPIRSPGGVRTAWE